MPNNFDKILATCRSRGVYCVPILQSLAQLKTLFTDGAWEGIVGNCDTFIYLGGNEASTYEYVSKLLGKWTIDKRTSGESKGTSGSYSENYDVLGRELMLEYELRLLPDDECIIFVRGENPIRDKKWFPWEHEVYLEARKCGAFVPAVQKEKQKQQMEECDFIGEESLLSLIHIYKELDEAQAGDNAGVLLRGIQKTDIERGQVLCQPGTLTCHTKFTAQVYVLTKDEGGRHTPFFNNYRPQFYFRTTDVTGVIKLPEGTEMCVPGDNVEMEVELITPIAIEKGLRFAIREGGRTVGSGAVIEVEE